MKSQKLGIKEEIKIVADIKIISKVTTTLGWKLLIVNKLKKKVKEIDNDMKENKDEVIFIPRDESECRR